MMGVTVPSACTRGGSYVSHMTRMLSPLRKGSLRRMGAGGRGVGRGKSEEGREEEGRGRVLLREGDVRKGQGEEEPAAAAAAACWRRRSVPGCDVESTAKAQRARRLAHL